MMIKFNTEYITKITAVAVIACCAAFAQDDPWDGWDDESKSQSRAQAGAPSESGRPEASGGVPADLSAGVQDAESVARYKAQAHGGARRGTELSAAALASAPYLFFERDARGRIRPGSARLEVPKDRAAYQLFDKALVRFSGKTPFNAGDTVDLLRSGGLIPFKGRSAQLLTRVGRAVVEEMAGRKIVIRINEMWGVVTGGESIVPAERFVSVYCDSLGAPDTEINASVVRRIESSIAPHLHQYFIIDKGEADGVRIGDFFRVRERRPSDQLSAELLEAQVVNVTPISATLVIQKLSGNSLSVGDIASLSRRPVTAARTDKAAAADEPVAADQTAPESAQ